VGLAGAAVLVAARWLDRPGSAAPHRALDDAHVEVIAALVPVVLAGSLPTVPAEREAAMREVVEAFDRAVGGLGPAVQGEIRDLLSLLHFAPSRAALAGVGDPWRDASAESIAQFLTRWRESRFDLFRAGYQALTQLLQAAWYGNARSWPAIGYPGPPSLGTGR